MSAEAGIRAADLGIQILGGYGYLTEYRVAQTWRDARITSIYEGANAIHELATATRGLRGPGAEAFAGLIGRLSTDPEVHQMLAAWHEARAQISQASDPRPLAHDFTQATCRLFHKAALSRLTASTR